ncbi:TolC family protein [Pseudomonas syringae]|uniref:TolC family protein n=1 Tax=Pseudomonas syringae TaxID=317 RepID=UPI003F873B73
MGLVFYGTGLCASPLIGQKEHVDLWALYQMGMSSDPRVQGAGAKVHSAESRVQDAVGKMRPQIGGRSSFSQVNRNQETGSQAANGTTYRLSISQVLYQPAIWREMRKYESMTDQYKSQYEDTKATSVVEMVERYFNALEAEDELRLVTAQCLAMQRNLDLLQAMYKHRLVTLPDVLKISARLDELEASKFEAQESVKSARELLAEWLGQIIDQPLKRISPDAIFNLVPYSERTAVAFAMDNNPALHAGYKKIKTTEAAIGQAKADYLPTVAFDLGAQRSDFTYDNIPSPQTDTISATVTVNFPLYSGGSTSAKISELNSERDIATQEHEALRRLISAQTKISYNKTEIIINKIKASKRALESAVDSRKLIERSFSLKISTSLDLLSAIEDEYRARRKYFQAQYDFVLNYVVLQKWEGRLTDQTVREINIWLSAPDTVAE